MSSKQNDRHIIWSDIHLDFEDWRADLEEQYPDLSEDELIQKMYEINSSNSVTQLNTQSAKKP